jgi:hypothetical protein
MIRFCLGVPNIEPLWPVGILGKVCFHVFAKPISDPRESVLVSGLHFLCPYLEVNRWVILRRLRAVLSWLTPPPKLRTAICGSPKIL